MDNNIVFNQKINENNFIIYKRKNKIIVDEIIPFIIDYLKITLNITNQKILSNESDLPQFDGDRGIFNSYSKVLLTSFKEQFSLNSDIYNFKNEFFEEKKTKKLEKNKTTRNVILKNIEIYRNNNQLYIGFEFSVKFILNKELKEFPIIFTIVYGDITQKKIILKPEIIKEISEKWHFTNYQQAIENYEFFLKYQEKLITEYNQQLQTLQNTTINLENEINFIY